MGTCNLQSRLARARWANRPGSRLPVTVVVLPSYSVGSSLLAHYGERIPALEHGLPLNGTPASLWPLGFKSNGRRLMRGAGVPLPLGQ
jgi:hypothetical protein